MDQLKVVIIGAGSPCFGANLIADVLGREELRGSSLGLVDTDEVALDRTARFARQANDEMDFGLEIMSSPERRDVLQDADFVISAIGVDTIPLWQREWEITQSHGIHHAWCGLTGPAGLVRTLRMVPPTLGICRDMESFCPGARLLNYANPVSRLGYAIAEHSYVQSVGLCHALSITVRHLAGILEVAPSALRATAAGINHFSFILDLRYAETGGDAYPVLRQALRTQDPTDQPLSRATFDAFGLYPVPDDREVSDYVGYCHSASHRSWLKYGLGPLDWAAERLRRATYWSKIDAINEGVVPASDLLQPSGEQAIDLAMAIATNSSRHFPAVNIPNEGYMPNLAYGGCVEVPAIVDASGVRGVGVGPMPPAIASLCERQLAIQALSVEAAVKGSRDLAVQALAIDPVVHDLEAAAAALDQMLLEERQHIPAFE